MNDARCAPVVGIVASVAVILVLGIPCLLLTPRTVSAYYGVGAFNPLFAGLFALVCVIIFAAGQAGRSDPAIAAGVSLVFGVFILGFTVIWAMAVPTDLVLSFPTVAAFEYHRYALVLSALIIPASAVWYARALELL